VFLLLAFAPGADAGAPVGHLTAIRGSVELGGRPVTRMTPVEIGQVVETRDGKCTLLLGKGSVVYLAENSRLEITQHLVDTAAQEDTRLNLPYGKVRALVRSGGPPKTFKIRSRAAVMGVRGTQIYMDTPKDPALPQSFATFDGVAYVELGGAKEGGRAPKSVTLQKGETLQGGEPGGPGAQAPRIAKLAPEAMRQLAQQVAPPPPSFRSPDDVKRGGGNRKPAGFGPRPGPGGPGEGEGPVFPGGFPMKPPGLPPLLDPVRDAVPAPVTIRVDVRRQ
jgi:hypothetical protein